MPKNDDLNKIRDAVRRAQGTTPGAAPPPATAPQRAAPAARARPTPRSRTAAATPSSGAWVTRRLRAAGWAWVAAVLAIWTAGVIRQVWWGSGYRAGEGRAVGRYAAAVQSEYLLVAGVVAVVLVVILGRWGVWLTVGAAAVVGALPRPAPEQLVWLVEAVPNWARDVLLDIGGGYGAALKWMVFLIYVPLTLMCFGRAFGAADGSAD